MWPVADGAEQAAVADVRVDADVLAQVGDGAGGALGDLPAGVAVGLGEDPGQVAGLVDGQRVALGVAQPSGVGLPRKDTAPSKCTCVPGGVGQPHAAPCRRGGAQGGRPGDLPAVRGSRTPSRPGDEGPDVQPVEGDHHRVDHGRRHDQVLVGDGTGAGEVTIDMCTPEQKGD